MNDDDYKPFYVEAVTEAAPRCFIFEGYYPGDFDDVMEELKRS